MGMQQTNTYINDPLLPTLPHPAPCEMAVVMGASLTLTKGTVLAQNTVDGKWYAYVNAGANGTGTPRAILKDNIKTDANGKVSYSDQATEKAGQVYDNASAYYMGVFTKGQLGANFDATAQAALGRFITGNITANAAYDLFLVR